MTYDEELDEWICANNNRLTFQYEKKRNTDNGYETVKRKYICTNCHGCPLQTSCTKGKDTKSISVFMKN
ncbi:MAG: transposase [Bacillota bacterium]|nr:transposase [Bacillota bacterium]